MSIANLLTYLVESSEPKFFGVGPCPVIFPPENLTSTVSDKEKFVLRAIRKFRSNTGQRMRKVLKGAYQSYSKPENLA